MNHVRQFETLRGLAAVWVFLSHTLLIAEISVPVLGDGIAAVDVFVILSGFVITLLRLNNPEPYSIYITRRFARLYPLFLVALVLGLMTSHLYAPVVGGSFWGGEEIDRFMTREQNLDASFWEHLLLHLTMLHGAVPDTVLPQASLMFSGPLWSISLEWQFYLIAPALIWALDISKRGRLPWALAAIVLMGLALFATRRLWQGEVPSFLPLRLHFFAVGVVCGLGWGWARTAPPWLVAAAVILCAAGLGFSRFSPATSAVVAWTTVYLVAAVDNRSRLTAPISRILTLRPLRWIGERSYGIYVLHMPLVLLLADALVIPYAARIGQVWTFVLLTAVSLPVALLAAAACYALIERPVIAWAKTFRWRAEGAPRPVVTPAS